MRARPGLEALKKAAEDKRFDAVLVDDASRLSRDNQHFNTLLCLFEFWGTSLISVSDGLDTREEHAKVAYQFRGIINELYLTDPKKKTHRSQTGQVLRGFSVGSRGYGYASVPDGETKHDMEAAKDHAFTPPPRPWITERIGKLNHLLAKRTEKSALALRG